MLFNKKIITVLVITTILILPIETKAVFNRYIGNNMGFYNDLDYWECTNCGGIANLAGDRIDLGTLNNTAILKQAVNISDQTTRATLEVEWQGQSKEISSDDNDSFTIAVNNTITGENYFTKTYKIIEAEENEPKFLFKNAGQYAGQSIDLVFTVVNNDTKLSQARIFVVLYEEISHGLLIGHVYDPNDNKLAKAKVILRDYDGNIIWHGRTNQNGIFKARHLDATKNGEILHAEFHYNGKRRWMPAGTIDWGKPNIQFFHLKSYM